MSEHLSNHEIKHHHETAHEESKEHFEHKLRESEARAEKAKIHSHEEIERLKLAAEAAATSAKEVSINQSESAKYHPTQSFVNREIRDMAYQRLLIRARKHLSTPQKALSKVMHQPLVEELSEVGGKTVARPSGILGGGIVALIGTSAYYYLTKSYGYNYNNFIFIGLLILGFIGGWSIEVFLRFKKRSA